MEGESCCAFWNIVNMGELRSVRTDCMRRQKFVVFPSCSDKCSRLVCSLRTETRKHDTISILSRLFFCRTGAHFLWGCFNYCWCCRLRVLGIGWVGADFPGEQCLSRARTVNTTSEDRNPISSRRAARRSPRAMTTASVASFPVSCGKGPVAVPQ